MGTNSDRAMRAFERGVADAVEILAGDDDQVRRGLNAGLLIERAQAAMGEFAEQRTGALRRLRAGGLSLADMSKLFGVTRMALSDAINRDTARVRKAKARKAAKRAAKRA